MRAKTLDNEPDRLEELASYGILDTDPDPEFDDVVALIAEICKVPVALVSFVDKDRQWFKSRHGIDVPETPLNVSVCSHAILNDELLEIPDTLEDERTADNTLTLGPAGLPMRFYAGAPLISQAGLRLGTLCILDVVPRVLTDLQRSTLRVLSRQIMRQVELHRMVRTEEVLRKEIDHRVKNSLQSVASFVRLYAKRARQPEARNALGAIGRRVDAIAQLHRELYQTSHFDMIRLDSYLGRLAGLLQGSAPAGVTVRTDIVPASVDSRRAASLGMIISEFTANSIKHAFPDGRRGQIEIILRKGADESLQLLCRDDGIGDAAPPSEEEEPMASIGQTLMESAAEQIGSRLEMEATGSGYLLRLDIPDPLGAHRATADALSVG